MEDLLAFEIGYRFRVNLPDYWHGIIGEMLYATCMAQAYRYAKQTGGVIVPLCLN